MKKDVVTLLVTDAMRLADVDRAALSAELDAVNEALRHPHSAEEFEELLVRRRWCEVRLGLLEESDAIRPRS